MIKLADEAKGNGSDCNGKGIGAKVMMLLLYVTNFK